MSRVPILRKKDMSEIKKLVQICHSNLKNSSECLHYLKEQRGLSDDIIKKYQLGFFPQNISKLTQYVSNETLRELNIINYSENSPFSEFFYLIFPIFSEYGEAVGIGGRTLVDDAQRSILNLPKYKNSSFKKSEYLFGLNHSRKHILKKNNVFVVEGYFDHMAMDSNGIKNSVAICGTAFSVKHFLKLAKYTNKITFILDSDDGGMKSMERIESKFSNKGIKLRFLKLPKIYKDVDNYFTSGKNSESFIKELKTYSPNLNWS